MVKLERQFEAQLREALLQQAERQLREKVGPALIETAREHWQEYAAANDYDIDHVWEDVEGPIVERDGDSVRLRVEWPELTALFEFGVSPHTIEGDPLLHFYWAEKDQWVQTESVEWGSETGGIPRAGAIQAALRTVRGDLRS